MVKSNKYRIPQIRLNAEYEYVNILDRIEGSRNSLGEPIITWTTTGNVKCFKTLPNQVTANQLSMFNQGMVQISNYWAMFEHGTTIQSSNKIVDENNVSYEVLETIDLVTHKEALLKRVV